ncbi:MULTISPECIES: ECF transporter S component [unclassified Granulicatella]|uniref:ECF transporter S component n=1 Tax=unclassified Granulicatella TaxID=2630493 RepID=UPI0013D4EFEC|nr:MULTISPECIES: ECF transporter S component [unclassified Granulicatella]QMI86344.1 ECF transporter S component [Carnobacteriaceae bacterium zg-84]
MKVRKLTTLAVLIAVTIILSKIEIPIIPYATFLKLDFSDTVVFIAGLLYGYSGLLTVAIGKGLLLLLTGSDMIGAVASICATIIYVGIFYILYKKNKHILLPSICSTLTLAICLSALNYVVFIPLYETVFHMELGNTLMLVLTAVLPFNLIKGIALSIVNSILVKNSKRFMM